jgi:type IV pilus assembly protein PilC
MQTYAYTAREASGKKVKSEIEAESESGAAKMLQERGITPIDIVDKEKSHNPLDILFKRIASKDKVIFSRQLSTLINAGLPIVQSLQNVSDQTPNKNLKDVISKVIADIEGGSSFADALSNSFALFVRYYALLVDCDYLISHWSCSYFALVAHYNR